MNEIKNVKNYKDFREVYGVFKKEPFYEDWTEEQFYEEYMEILKNGEIFGYYDNNRIVSLLNIIYGAQKKHPVTFENPDKVIYISDIATLVEYRNKGYGSTIAKYGIEYAKSLNNYDEMYLRTNVENSMSEPIFLANGFEVMKKDGELITQDVWFKRTRPDIPETDTRKFLSRRLKLK